MFSEIHPIHYVPVFTTIISATFFGILAHRYMTRGGTHHLWWGIGVLTYGIGTALEGSITLFGNSIALNKAWYIAGALLGGYPLAQGSVYFHLRKKTAHILTAVTVPFIATLAMLVILSPTDIAAMEPHRPGGAILGWQWIRWFTPVINTYAAIFLIGTAIRSSLRAFREKNNQDRAWGNSLIAIGAILPGIGGSFAKAGMVEALYAGEFVGIILIWIGYSLCVRPARSGAAVASQVTSSATA